MKKTSNYGLVQYESSDKMNITGSQDSLNATIQIIDKKLKEIEDKPSGGTEETSSPLKGKKLSLIGDSITTYEGYLPTGNKTRYPKGVITNVEQTWWKQLLNETGMVLGQNCAWDGSTCSGLSTSTTVAYAGCSDKRISQLGLNGTPDIIICYIGINDWGATYNRNQTHYGGSFVDGAFIPVGDYTGETALPSGELKTFSEAYGCMIGKIQTKYPNAKLYCCTLPQTNAKNPSNYDADSAFPSVNRNGISLASYNERIRLLAKNMGASVIEFSECGIHWGNFSTYMEDGLHPNIEGMKLLKEKAKNKLKLDFNAETTKVYVSDSNTSYDDSELRALIAELQSNKQDTLVSGENIKTINGNSILGEGDLELRTQMNYTISVDGENITLSNPKDSISEGSEYRTEINCNNGYKFGNVIVKIDGNDVTSDVYTKNSNTNAMIVIPRVTGDVHISIETIAVQNSYSVTNNLTNAKTSNNSLYVIENDSYEATITPDKYYSLGEGAVIVSMGSADVTSQVYSNGVINIPNVTGDIVIRVDATKNETIWYTNNAQDAYTASASGTAHGWAVDEESVMNHVVDKPVNRVSFVSLGSSGTMEICLATALNSKTFKNIEYVNWDASNKTGKIVTIEIPTVTPKTGEYFVVFAHSTPASDAFAYNTVADGEGDFYSFVNNSQYPTWAPPSKYKLMFNFGYCQE